jgi:hypothetical protein
MLSSTLSHSTLPQRIICKRSVPISFCSATQPSLVMPHAPTCVLVATVMHTAIASCGCCSLRLNTPPEALSNAAASRRHAADSANGPASSLWQEGPDKGASTTRPGKELTAAATAVRQQQQQPGSHQVRHTSSCYMLDKKLDKSRNPAVLLVTLLPRGST